MILRLATSLLCGAAVVSFASSAHAQTTNSPASTGGQLSDAPPTPSSDSSTQSPGPEGGDIIVTAQKRAENLQNVPLAVQVVTGEQLQANGVRDFADLNRAAPSLVVKPAENPVNASVSIRGIGTFAFSIGVEPSVAVIVDDVPIAFQARAFADLVDVERIEVLRGPQSTLYGKSASAGLINIVTPGPSSTLTAKANAFGTTDSEYGGNAVISGPLTDTLGFRTTANYDNYDGNVRNLTTGDKVNGRRIFSTRNKLTWTPGDGRATVTAAVDYIDGRTTIGRPFVRVGQGALLRGNAAYPQSVWAPGITVGPDNRDVDNNYTSGTMYHDFAQSLRTSLDVGGPSLVSITSHDSFKLTDTLDQDESPIAALDNRQFGTFRSDQFTQELRLVSPGTDRFRYTLGAFYAAVDYSRDFTRGPFYSQARWFARSKTDEVDAFGQLEFDLLPGTTAIGGIRQGHETVRYSFQDILAGAFFSGHSTEDFTTYKGGLQQHLGRDVMLFATYSTGHKGQTYDLSTGFNANRALAGPVRPETSRDWEVGARTQFLDRHLTLNVTGFDTRYRDFQAQGIETLPDGTVNYRLTNVGRIRTRGIEGELSARVSHALSLGLGATYLDAVITEFPDAQCFPAQTSAQGCKPAVGGRPAFQNLAGRRPPQAPEWKVNGTLDYAHDLGSLPIQGVVQAAAVYQSGINYSLNEDPETAQGGYTIINLSAGVRNQDRGYSVMLFVNNLLDRQYYQNLADSRGNYNNVQATQAYLPRDFRRYGGIRASVTF